LGALVGALVGALMGALVGPLVGALAGGSLGWSPSLPLLARGIAYRKQEQSGEKNERKRALTAGIWPERKNFVSIKGPQFQAILGRVQMGFREYPNTCMSLVLSMGIESHKPVSYGPASERVFVNATFFLRRCGLGQSCICPVPRVARHPTTSPAACSHLLPPVVCALLPGVGAPCVIYTCNNLLQW
jgi:hypothetical protein